MRTGARSQLSTTRLLAATAAGFAVMFIVNALAAAVIIDPLFGDDYPEIAPAASTTLDWPLLLGGYAIIAITLGWLLRGEPRGKRWIERGLGVGVPVGLATFGGVHLVQAGYTTIDNSAWILSGMFDVFGPVAAALVIARGTSGQRENRNVASRIDQQLGRLDDPAKVDAHLAQLETVSATLDRHVDRLRQQSNNVRSSDHSPSSTDV